jgi:hypothetical protein
VPSIEKLEMLKSLSMAFSDSFIDENVANIVTTFINTHLNEIYTSSRSLLIIDCVTIWIGRLKSQSVDQLQSLTDTLSLVCVSSGFEAVQRLISGYKVIPFIELI